MSAQIKRIDILEVELPFKRVFRHALNTRRTSNSVFLKIYLENGVVGYGESLPREYVTNETTKSVTKKLREVLPKKLLNTKFYSMKKAKEFIYNLKELDGAAKCCLDIALLDTLGRFFNKSVSFIIGKPVRRLLFSTGIVSAGSIPAATKSAMEIKIFGFKSVKVKIGIENDLNRLKVVRSILGDKIDIRVDANCAWTAEEAIEKICQIRKFKISAIEQPVKPYDIRGLKKVTTSVPETIIADESLSTVKDAERFAKIKACNMFNIRLSKCGGIVNALKIKDVAERNSIRYELGCQVGESGLLTAAGRLFASSVKNIEYYEGSYGKFLLKDDITKEDMTFGLRGKTKAVSGAGLGINVVDKVLDKYTVDRFIIEQ